MIHELSGACEIRNCPFEFVLVNVINRESDFLSKLTTALERFFFSTVSVNVPLIEAVWECKTWNVARKKIRPARNFLMVNGLVDLSNNVLDAITV